MPMSRGQRLCPQARQCAASRPRALLPDVPAVMEYLPLLVTPVLEPLSLDEAFLDVQTIRRLRRPDNHRSTHPATPSSMSGVVTCSVGVAPSKPVMPFALRAGKADGMVIVPVDEVDALSVQQPSVGALWGCRNQEAGCGSACGPSPTSRTPAHDADPRPRGRRRQAFKTTSPGAGSSRVEQEQRERSIGSDETFAHDLDDPALIHRHLLALSERTASRVRKAGLAGRTISIKVRFADFTTITRFPQLREPTDVSREIYETAVGLYDALGLQRARIRLVGVRMDKLLPVEQALIQARLDEADHGWRDADRAIDRASARFGSGAVRPASLIPREQSSSRPPGVYPEGGTHDGPGPVATRDQLGRTACRCRSMSSRCSSRWSRPLPPGPPLRPSDAWWHHLAVRRRRLVLGDFGVVIGGAGRRRAPRCGSARWDSPMVAAPPMLVYAGQARATPPHRPRRAAKRSGSDPPMGSSPFMHKLDERWETPRAGPENPQPPTPRCVRVNGGHA